jgi:hypothetical protein
MSPLTWASLKVPKAEAVGDDRHHARPVQKTFLVGLEAPDRIAKHAHGAHLSERPGRIETHVLLELELTVEEEPQVLPDGLGAQGSGAHVRGIPKIDGRPHEGPSTGEVEDFRLVMFKDKPQGFERTEQPTVRFLKQGEIVFHPARLGDDGAIIDIRLFFFFFFFFKSTIYNAVLERSPRAHNTNSTYSKTTLRIARYYTTKRLGTSFWRANAGRSPRIFHYDVALSSGEKVEAPPPGPAHTVASHRIALGRSPDRNPPQRAGQSPEGVDSP